MCFYVTRKCGREVSRAIIADKLALLRLPRYAVHRYYSRVECLELAATYCIATRELCRLRGKADVGRQTGSATTVAIDPLQTIRSFPCSRGGLSERWIAIA
jgi:hypothetical protein